MAFCLVDGRRAEISAPFLVFKYFAISLPLKIEEKKLILVPSLESHIWC